MAYSSPRYLDETHFYLATLNKPHEDITPQVHVHWDEHVDWVEPADNLPRRGLGAT